MKVSVSDTCIYKLTGKVLDWHVYLDGNRIDNAIEADDERGTVLRINVTRTRCLGGIVSYEVDDTRPYVSLGKVTLRAIDEYGTVHYETGAHDGSNILIIKGDENTDGTKVPDTLPD